MSEFNKLQAAIKDGKDSEFWKAIREFLQEEISDIDIKLHDHFRDYDDEGIRDLLRMRESKKSLMTLPERIIGEVEESAPIPDLDPYQKTYNEKREDR